MAIKYRCPACGTEDVTDGSMAGREVACGSCGKTLRVPRPTAPTAASAPSSSETIRFRCVGCGKSLAAPAYLAGKKITCKSCGQTGLKVPDAAASAPAESKATAAKPRPTPPPAPADGPSTIDLYGLDDTASAPSAGGGGGGGLFADETPGPPPRPGRAVEEEAPLPSRKAFEPLTAEKKKKIAKRAEKMHKMGPAGFSSIGVSFGTILAITLFGLRLYRIGHKVTRGLADEPAASAPFEDAGFQPVNVDPKAAAAEGDREVERMLKEPGAAEAREWLDPAKHPNHAVFEMGNDRARAMIDGFYQRGARRVSVLDASPLGNAVVTNTIAVELPDEPAKRAECLAWEVQYLEGEDPSKDVGQKYLLITTD
jgi:DNA-directed RNA polymerase subunit RPC12/RpoP